MLKTRFHRAYGHNDGQRPRQARQDNGENHPQREHRGHRGQDRDKSMKRLQNIGGHLSSSRRECGYMD
jgi:hypothetical protein